ncbi:hypothetical protein PanWU01x14_170410, partial [Parasponia andersonii]
FASHIYKITPHCLIYGGTERVRRRDQKLASASTAELRRDQSVSESFVQTIDRLYIWIEESGQSPIIVSIITLVLLLLLFLLLLITNHSFYSSLRTILFLYMYVFVYVLVYIA